MIRCFGLILRIQSQFLTGHPVHEPPSLFDDLKRLGLPAGAPPEALKPAWRRTVSALHPDRNGAESGHELAEVNAAFQRLQAFVQLHGRLPRRNPNPKRDAAVGARARRRWPALGLGLLAGLVVLWPHPSPDEPAGASEGTFPEAVVTPRLDMAPPPIGLEGRAEHLRVGQDAAEAERIAGPPLFRSAERWEYGPSEIRFVDGKVSGWHSSPLRPLPVDDIAGLPPARSH